ncbi:MAG: histidine kinase [Herminiimonas sp.]|nr:histidine kinase [Herminiimonas sp.]MDB5853822.1 histidine kinase [Herminiimonas sp.]
MTLSTDQTPDGGSLSDTSRKLLELRDAVLAEWEERVRASVTEASPLAHPVLVNTMPALVDNVAEALSSGYPRTSAGVAVPTVASEHGGERARLTDYNCHAVISEYQILRQTIFDVLQQNSVQLSEAEIRTVNTSFDAVVKESVTAFVLVQSAFRERFVAALAHDLRNPLAYVNTAAEIILRTDDLPRIHGIANKILENADRMGRMIQDVLDAMIFQSGERLRLHPSEFDMMDLAKEVCERSRAAHGERFEVAGEPVRGWWDRDLISRALENLLENAVKYGATERPIKVQVVMAHGRVILTVHNEGDPIPPDNLEIVFQVFRRAEAAKAGDKPGWGIGLPYVRSVAESHGGSIGVDSSKELGTTFTIDVPIDARPFENAPTLGQPH